MSYTFTLQEEVRVWVDREVEIPKERIEDIKQQVLENGGSIEDFEEAVNDWIADNKWDYTGDADYCWDTEESVDWQYVTDSYNDCIEEILGDYGELFQDGLVGEIE